MGAARAAWNKMIERRVARTSNILAQLKVVKMSGASGVLQRLLQRFRIAEVQASLKERNIRITLGGLGKL